MRVVVAPDKFKGSLTAAQVAAHVAAGLRAAVPGVGVDEVPVADGGEGTVDAAVAAGFTPRHARVTGPTGERLDAPFAVRDATAVLEMAVASGLAVLPDGRSAALTATSLGTGQLISAALDAGCTQIMLGVGGSACTDGGAGMLAGLGVRLLDAGGADLGPGGAALRELHRVDMSGLDPRLAGATVLLASDVDNPLLGENGAAAVYAPQKGASAADVTVLQAGLRRWVQVLNEVPGLDAQHTAQRDGAGAAGGVGFAAMAVLRAARRAGVEVVLDLVGLGDYLAGADLVITGEGSVDEQTLRGKTPAGVAAAARAAGVPVVAVCGRLAVAPDELARATGIAAVYALTDIESDTEECMAQAGPLLERLAARVADEQLGAAPVTGKMVP